MRNNPLIVLALIVNVCLSFAAKATSFCPVNLGPDVETCEGETVLLDGSSATSGTTYTWFFNNTLLPGETNSTLLVTQSGLYRVEALTGSASCSSETNVTFNPVPFTTTPADLEACDDDNDGFGIFDLTVVINEVTAGNPNLNVTFHETFQEATDGILVIADPPAFQNTINPQEIFIRSEDLNTGCFSIEPLIIIVNPNPSIESPNDLFENDTNGDDTAIFDLTSNTPVILGTQDPNEFMVMYYETQVDAIQNTNPIVNPTAYTNSTNPQTIFVRVQSLATECFETSNFSISAITLPDTDSDGVPDENEDLNNNGNLEDDDTDNDGIPNYLDDDDDGDSVNTVDEISGIGAGFTVGYSFIDTDNDTIENYLDDDDDGDLVLTSNEDYNNNGTPIDDDTNNNGIPDFLDNEATLSFIEFSNLNLFVYPNPTAGKLYFDYDSTLENLKITLYTIAGKEVEFTRGKKHIDISKLSVGIYFLRIENKNQFSVQKIIKK